MRAPDRRRAWRRAVAVGALLAGAALGLGPAGRDAGAQAPGDLAGQFGGFHASGRANGLQLTYDVENLLPLPPPLFQASIPEASASMQSGPTSVALGSVAYPGDVVGNLPALVAQAAPDAGVPVPPYPLVARAEFPSGAPEVVQDIGTASSSVAANDAVARSSTTMGGGDLPPFVRIGAITTSAQTQLLDGAIESRSRVELTGVDILYGLVRIESVVTDLVGTTDGVSAASAGGTQVSGVQVLGLPATIGPDGITFSEEPPPAQSGPLATAVDGLGLGGLAADLGPALEPLNQARRDVLGTTQAGLGELLAAAGISIRTMEPFESVAGPAVERTANGLVVDVVFDGRGDNPLAQLLAAVPTDDLPGESLPGVPLNTSPQALVNLLKETHVAGLALAYGNVSLEASPAFEVGPVAPSSPGAGGGGLGGSGLGGPRPGGGVTPGFATATPPLGPGAGPADVGVTPAAAVTGTGAAAAVVLAVVTSPVWAVGSRRLADTVLGAAASSCPEGLDRLPKEV